MLPDPLHPVVVHFPIVFLLSGLLLAVGAVFIRRRGLAWIAFAILALGAAGTVAAVGTGNDEASRAGGISEAAEDLLDEHEEWGETTRNVALVTALVALTAAGAAKVRFAGRGLSAATALLAGSAVFCTMQTGHLGGQLVYKHGVGISKAAKSGGASPQAQQNPTDDSQDEDDQ